MDFLCRGDMQEIDVQDVARDGLVLNLPNQSHRRFTAVVRNRQIHENVLRR